MAAFFTRLTLRASSDCTFPLSLECRWLGMTALRPSVPPISELFGRIRKHGIVCIENGVNVSKYANASSTMPAKCILALGRLSSNKRLDHLISFIAALRRHDPHGN